MMEGFWILILWVRGYQAGGPAMGEFYDKYSCEQALAHVRDEWTGVQGFCVPKHAVAR